MTIPKYFRPDMEQKLDGLSDLARDCSYSWVHGADEIWRELDAEFWAQTRNPWLVLQAISRSRLEDLSQNEAFCEKLRTIVSAHRQALSEQRWFQTKKRQDIALRKIAYFSMEFGLSEALPIYSGGLGLLAGDHLKAANDLGLPLVGVGLLYQKGYFRQAFDADGNQIALYPSSETSDLPVCPVRINHGEWLRIQLLTPSRLWVRVWQAQIGRIKLYLLDSNDPANHPVDRCITAELYGGESEYRLSQEILLGIGGWQVLQALGITPEVCHLNEGHAALLVLERARHFMNAHRVDFATALTVTRAGNLFTTHTSVEAGFDRFSPELIKNSLGLYAKALNIDLDTLLALGRNPGDNNPAAPFNMACLAIRGSAAVNGVSRLHAEVSRNIFLPLFPGWPKYEIPVTHVTNGVHVPAWDSMEADELWTNLCGKNRWLYDPDHLAAQFRHVKDHDLWNLRAQNRSRLVQFVRDEYSRELNVHSTLSDTELEDLVLRLFDPNVLTIGFARRFATYKRPNLLLTDPERLARLLTDPHRPVQLVISGKAHPADLPGQRLIKAWHQFIRRPEIRERAIFLSDYDMITAEYLVQGVDLWINTPRRPWEACGTSGMKILVNGGLNLSELDGWWAEAYRPEVGWALNGHEAEHTDAQQADMLYGLLENEIVPAFYRRNDSGIPERWVAKMRESMTTLTPYFSANRMVREYTDRFYLSLAEQYQRRAANGARSGRALTRWLSRLNDLWPKIHVAHVEIENSESMYSFRLQVYLGDLTAQDVKVELFAEPTYGDSDNIYEMRIDHELPGAVNGFVYSVEIPAKRPISDYTPRIIPSHPDVSVPTEAQPILWVK
ncbi:MAG: alpha-glucan family phosphorylase [Methylobacter sp.]|uniref:alpha-glucan family phosphorylase n=1 Tax=Methylobacter sp. TaxID=2051955 RepID=UPI00258C3F9A|nr:alpha-glucan family phosphorylase [Methylobacter sp.]MCL7422589.1 alpha-glucan family phosphorylase [Methylobacter sp.]